MAEEARDAAERSIKLDDQNPEGYMALAGLLPLTQYAARETLLKKAISVRRLECGCEDRKSTRLNSSHVSISYAVFCLKKKNFNPFSTIHLMLRRFRTRICNWYADR